MVIVGEGTLKCNQRNFRTNTQRGPHTHTISFFKITNVYSCLTLIGSKNSSRISRSVSGSFLLCLRQGNNVNQWTRWISNTMKRYERESTVIWAWRIKYNNNTMVIIVSWRSQGCIHPHTRGFLRVLWRRGRDRLEQVIRYDLRNQSEPRDRPLFPSGWGKWITWMPLLWIWMQSSALISIHVQGSRSRSNWLPDARQISNS